MKTNWNYPTSLWVGQNRVKDLTNACQNLKIKKPKIIKLTSIGIDEKGDQVSKFHFYWSLLKK